MAKRSGKRRTARRPRPTQDWTSWLLGVAEGYEGYFSQSRSLALSFVLITPLLLIYEFALVYFPVRPIAAGQFIRSLLASVFHSKAGIVLNILVVLFLILAVIVLARRRRLRLNLIVPMLFESLGWALVVFGIGLLILYHRIDLLPKRIEPGEQELLQNVISSVGAGVYEEILFRLFLTSLLYLACLKLFQGRTERAAVLAVVLSALVFATCHQPRTLAPFLFYFTSGVLFSGLYTWRGLGVAVYTHAIYDIMATVVK